MTKLSPEEISRLSPPERLDLISALWDSFAEDGVPLTSAQHEEISRRLDSFTTDLAEGISWQQLKDELAKRAR
jgi:putative addiction module component (TIGR02574 family)